MYAGRVGRNEIWRKSKTFAEYCRRALSGIRKSDSWRRENRSRGFTALDSIVSVVVEVNTRWFVIVAPRWCLRNKSLARSTPRRVPLYTYSSPPGPRDSTPCKNTAAPWIESAAFLTRRRIIRTINNTTDRQPRNGFAGDVVYREVVKEMRHLLL